MTSTKQSHTFMLVWMCVQWLMAVLLGAAPVMSALVERNPFPLQTLIIITDIIGNILPVALAYLLMKMVRDRAGVPHTPLVAVKKPEWLSAVLAVAMGVCIMPVGMVFSFLSQGFDNSTIDTIQVIMNESGFLANLLILALMPAVSEELVCRGVALGGYRHVAVWKAAAMNGLIFGVMHMNLRQFFYAFALGAAIALVVIYSGSVIYGMIMHFVVNGVQVAISGLAAARALPRALLSVQGADGEVVSGAGLMIGLGAVMVVSLLLFDWLLKRFKARCQRMDTLTLKETVSEETNETVNETASEATDEKAIDNISKNGRILNWQLILFLVIGGARMFSEFIA